MPLFTFNLTAIFWEEDDLGFFTGSADGVINYWRVDESGPQKTLIATFPNLSITSITGLFGSEPVL